MRLKIGKFGPFWSCHRYPNCSGTLNVNPADLGRSMPQDQRRCQAKTKRGRPCPIRWLANVEWQRNERRCHIHATRPLDSSPKRTHHQAVGVRDATVADRPEQQQAPATLTE